MLKQIVWLIICLVLPTSVWAESFVIDEYDVTIAIQSDGSLLVNEVIDVTFSELRHGIERKLPYRYEYNDDQDEILSYNNFSINNQFTILSDGPDKVLRIGNPDVFVNGEQSYTLSYTASPWIIQYSGYQELYRNIVGTQRDTSIAQVNFTISAPDTIDLSQLKSGDIIIVKWWQWSTWWIAWTIQDQKVTGQTTDLLSNQWVTIGIKFADQSFSGIISPTYENSIDDSFNEEFSLWDKILWLSPFIIFVVIWLGGYLLSKYKEQQKIKRAWPLVTQYYPPVWVTPALAGYIDNDQFDTSDFMATLYDWWARWYLTISQETEDKFFGKKSHITYQKIKSPTDLVPYEQIIWDTMFSKSDVFDFDTLDQSMRVNEEKNFFDTIKEVIEVEWDKYYDSRWLWWQEITDEWIRVFAHLRGYRDFIEQVEQEKLKEFLRQDPLFIDKLLPWAVVFGLETQLVSQLEWIAERNQPTWYRGDVFNVIILNNMLINSSKAIDQTYQSAYPRSSWWGFGGGGISVGGWGWGGWGWSR